eukprot:Sdes_comp9392_c0_seq2m853
MKFARYLQEHQVPEWSSQYVNYKLVKKRIKEISSCFSSNNSLKKKDMKCCESSPELVKFCEILEQEVIKVNKFYIGNSIHIPHICFVLLLLLFPHTFDFYAP